MNTKSLIDRLYQLGAGGLEEATEAADEIVRLREHAVILAETARQVECERWAASVSALLAAHSALEGAKA